MHLSDGNSQNFRQSVHGEDGRSRRVCLLAAHSEHLCKSRANIVVEREQKDGGHDVLKLPTWNLPSQNLPSCRFAEIFIWRVKLVELTICRGGLAERTVLDLSGGNVLWRSSNKGSSRKTALFKHVIDSGTSLFSSGLFRDSKLRQWFLLDMSLTSAVITSPLFHSLRNSPSNKCPSRN